MGGGGAPRFEDSTDMERQNMDIKRNIEAIGINNKASLKKDKFGDKRVKHPFLITREDIDAVVEDNIIVESNLLRLIRPGEKRRYEDRSLIPHKRVARGWNLQYAVVPQQYLIPQKYYYYRVKKNGR